MRFLLDANVLLLLIVGYVDRELIPLFGRTRAFTATDFDTLVSMIPANATIVTTPHILAETSNLTGQDDTHGAALLRAQMQLTIEVLEERGVKANRASRHPLFSRLGLTDAAIATLMTDAPATVITTDVKLWTALLEAGVPVENLLHHRRS